MLDTEKVIEIAKNKNGLVTSADVTTLGISRMVLKYLVEQGKLIKMARGVYALPSTMEDKYFDEQNRCHKGIYNSLSSLYLLGYLDSDPNKLYMAFPQTYNTTKLKARGIVCMNQAVSNYDVGTISVKTPRGNVVRTYCIERTLCEVMRDSEVSRHVVRDAFAQYLRNNDANLKSLRTFAKMFGVESKVNTFLEVLL
ncbi:MAG: type IV toxin-antitoxin system AbiEi family antitoxin domain-containing protein [Bacilli bacterium]|nr:type IV toxin-antitoxin system AbiEi family antitoxin domain-containing protein [Bacilli bacterium]